MEGHANTNHLPSSGRLSEIDTGSDIIGANRRNSGTMKSERIDIDFLTPNAFRQYVSSLAGVTPAIREMAGTCW